MQEVIDGTNTRLHGLFSHPVGDCSCRGSWSGTPRGQSLGVHLPTAESFDALISRIDVTTQQTFWSVNFKGPDCPIRSQEAG